MQQVAPAPAITVAGNVEGSIVVGDNNFVVNANYGTIVYRQAGPQVRQIQVAPRPPRAPRGFVGRLRELAALNRFISEGAPVLLSGVDGIGKSTLLKYAANSDAARAQPGGVVFFEGVDQAGTTLGWTDLLQKLFEALYESDPPLKVTQASARTYLSNTNPLVLLDQFNLPASLLNQLLDLFPQSPLVIATGGGVYSDGFEQLKLESLPAAEAAELLVSKAGIDRQQVPAEILEKTCTLLHGIPLAVTLVGNLILENGLSCEQALSALEAIQPQSTQPYQAAIERSFRFASSYLSPDDLRMMALVAAAPGISVSRGWLEEVAGGEATSQKMERLALLQPNSPRLRLHPDFAPYVLAGADIQAQRGQLLEALKGAVQARSLDFDFVREELGNLLGLISWAAEQERWEDVLALGRAVDPFLTLRGLWDAWEKSLRHVLDGARALNLQAVEAWALHQLGTRAMGVGTAGEAVNFLQQALELRRSLGDREGMAYTQHNLDMLLGPPGGGDGKPDGPKSPARRRVTRVFSAVLTLALLSGATLAGITRAGWVQLPPTGLDNRQAASIVGALPTPEIVVAPTETATATPEPTPTASPTPTATSTATATPTATASATPTITRTPTITPTPTDTLEPSITPSPTFSFPKFKVIVEQANCRYGPGSAYLYANGLYENDAGRAMGRNYNATWLYVQLDKDSKYCWVSSDLVEVSDDVKNIQVTPPRLPKTVQSKPPVDVVAERQGNQVTITWSQVHTNMEDARGYLLEITICQNGVRIPMVIGRKNEETSLTVQDDPVCTKSSSGVIYAADTRGYTDPIKINWPWPAAQP